MTNYTKYVIIWIIFCFATIGLIGTAIIASAEEYKELSEIKRFLKQDTTDQNKWTLWYSCDHFSRDLSRNASMQNITIGSVILSNHPTFRGKWNSHVVNYVIMNESIVIIKPQTDQVIAMSLGMMFDGKFFTYYRLYPDGTQVPTYWNCNLAHTGIIF